MLKVDQALISAFVAGGFALPIAHENIPYTPTGVAYAELLVMQNDVTGLTLKHSNQSDGVFRVILRYPLNVGAITAKAKVDQIFQVFKVGARITYQGRVVEITANKRGQGAREDSWYKIVVDMPYRAFF